MFARAAETLSKCMTDELLKQGKVYPDVSSIRDVSLRVAVEGLNEVVGFLISLVCSTAAETQLATKFPKDGETWESYIRKQMYTPQYAPLVWNDEGYAQPSLHH